MSSNVMLFCEYRISMFFMLAYMLVFLELEYSKVQSILMAVISYILTCTMETAIFFADYPQEMNIFILILEILAVQMTAYLLSSYRDMRAVFTGITSSTYVLPGNILYMGLATFEWRAVSPWTLLVPTGIHLLILVITMELLRDKYLREMESKSKLWNELWIVPAFFYGITYMLTMFSDTFFTDWKNWVAIFMILILMDIIYIFIIRMIANLHDDEEMRTGRELLEVYAEGLRGQTAELTRMEEKFRVMRHDNKYRYQLIRNCLEDGKIDQIREIVDQTQGEFQAITKKRFCNNVVVDGSIAVYQHRAEEQQIRFECQAKMPELFEKLNEFEFATVVMNLLDNAVRAASKVTEPEERLISIKIQPVKSQILLEVSNTYAGEHRISKITGLPLTDRGTEEHGFGMRSVQAYAAKNHGMLRYSIENGKFCVRLLAEI